jgi:hypothetical protein
MLLRAGKTRPRPQLTLLRSEQDGGEQQAVGALDGPRQAAHHIRQHLPRVHRRRAHSAPRPPLQLRRKQHLRGGGQQADGRVRCSSGRLELVLGSRAGRASMSAG